MYYVSAQGVDERDKCTLLLILCMRVYVCACSLVYVCACSLVYVCACSHVYESVGLSEKERE